MPQTTTVLFDLDGTLLPMDQDVFIAEYFSRLVANMVPLGYEEQVLRSAIWQGTAAMVQNDGSCTNERAFWHVLEALFGERVRQDAPPFRRVLSL